MAFVRMYPAPDGLSHFEELGLPFEPAGLTEKGSFSPKITGVTFSRQPVGYSVPEWHPTNYRHYVVFLTGNLEIEVGGGEGRLRRFGPGDVMLVEDVPGKGQGHRGWVVGNEPAISISLKL